MTRRSDWQDSAGTMDLRWVLFLFLVLCHQWALASPQQDFNRQFLSARIELAEDSPQQLAQRPGRMPGWMRWSLNTVFSKDPDIRVKAVRPDCQPQFLQDQLVPTTSAATQADLIRRYLDRCRESVETGVTSRVMNVFDTVRTHFKATDHPMIQRVTVHLPGGISIPGLLALKGDLKRRPFVVLRLGIFGTVTDFLAEKFLFMDLFEQGPANILALENSTGANFIQANDQLSMGGAFEGLQNLQVTRILTDPQEPLSKLISGLHFVGISLGGNSLFSTAILDPIQEGGPRISSYTAFCPVTRMEETFERGRDMGLLGWFADFWFSLRFAGLRGKSPELAENSLSVHNVIALAKESYPRLAPAMSAGLRFPPDWPKSMLEVSGPWKWFHHIQPPFLTIATADDEVVPVNLNFEPLRALEAQKDSNLGSVLMSQGFHCTLPAAYEWNTISAILNGSVLASDAKWKTQQEIFEIETGEEMKSDGKIELSYRVEWPQKPGYLTLKIRTRKGEPETTLNLPLSGFDFEIRDPQVAPEVRATIERWLAQNLKLSLQTNPAKIKLTWPKTI